MVTPDDGTLLITGASGYIGQWLAGAFARAGWHVAGTWRSNDVELPDVEMMRLDLADGRAVEDLVSVFRPTAVIHLAAATKVGWCEKHPDQAHAAIVGATENLVAALGKYAPRARLVHFSTDMVFSGEEAPYGEEAKAKPRNRYGSLKYASEAPALEHENSAVLRSALAYGPPASGRASFLSWMVGKLKAGEELTLFEDEWRTPVFVDDLVLAVSILLATENENGIFHAGGPDRLSRVEMGQAVCEEFELDGGGIKVLKRHDVPGGDGRPRDASLESERLCALGWKPTSFKEGIAICQEKWSS